MDYLLALQEVREGALSFLVPVLSVISELNVYVLPIVIAMVYWSYRKDWGIRMFFSFTVANFTANTMKSVMKVPRPFVKSSELKIAKAVEASATGYSFPSGHATAATSGWGHFALLLKRRWFTILAVIYIILTCFARNFLGAHTLLDVICGVSQTIIVIIAVEVIAGYIQKHPDKDILIALLLICISAASALIISNTYSIGTGDVEADKMMKDLFSSFGMMMGVSIGWIADRRFVKMVEAKDVLGRVLRCVICGAVFAVYYLYLSKKIVANMNICFGAFFRNVTTLFLVMIIIPIGINFVAGKREKEDSYEI